MASGVARSSPKREMSAPDTKALPPAPVTTTTRTSLSRANFSRMAVAASHMSSDTALRRSGLLKVSVPTPPSLCASTLSVSLIVPVLVCAASERVGAAQRRDLFRLESELPQNRVGVLAEIGRRRRQPARRARQPHGLARHAQRPAHLLDALRHAEMGDLRIGVDLIDGIDRPARHAGLVEPFDPVSAAALHRVFVDRGVER